MTIPFKDAKKEILSNHEVKDLYDSLEEKYILIEALIQARAEAGLTQEELASRIGTTQSAIARLESGSTMPSLKTLFKYAKATGMKPIITFERINYTQ
jgi:DNA-binding XRE family transcriptional regulator